MQAFESPIIRVSTGFLNTVNDTVIANQAGLGGVSKFAGQLGKMIAVGQEQISKLFDASVGTLFGGVYQYVQLSEELGTPQPVIGQVLFWDQAAGSVGDFIVTDTDGTTAVPQAAGVYIGGAEAGNYGFIQIAGPATGKFANSLTNVAQTGQGLLVDSGGFFNNGTPVNPVYTAYAIELPVNAGVKKVQLSGFLSFRG